ncbi:MAG: UDP-N-acetylmuramoyl-L-alanyl-D-glutamate--2,6-diaminopimelate ligase [Actinobacteria bacterium]|nr:UDP-N-acetylmuramoyl-L-alanyl-D-glutamate--2,6-diaminopimelate ligase [Actinomycetota bacterium]MCG2803158.1 UDP-N-acetylmuramoyl-L-alanyl-D-glutamate--2,6-diaminopimelate ligase [Cellulomonas sp.]
MTSPQGRLRPQRPTPRRLDDLVTAFDLATTGAAPVGVQVTGVAMGSADVVPGDLFIAVPGLKVHGARFVAQAIAAGAVAVLTDPAGAALVAAGPGLAELPVLITADPRDLAGAVAAAVYGDPARALVTVGVTGTNGKTTTSYFVDAALRAVHPLTAVLGTVELRIGDDAIESPRTTVEAPVLQAICALAVERGARSLVTEVSSHALALGRVHGLRFDVAGFTNLQRDHLDFHGDMEHYFADKARLFAPDRARRAVVVVDDEWGRRLAAEVTVPVETVSTHADDPTPADWSVLDAHIGLDGVGSRFVLRGPDGARHAATSPLPGLVNVSNAALAIVLAQAAGVPLPVAIEAVGHAHEIPGRMERVIERGQGLPLGLVDYAHTPDALVLALDAVRPITPGRLIIVLGSDGDRDQGKRPIMGTIAATMADEVIVTDENPRSEDPAAIRASILAGARSVPGATVHEETTSRAEAIRRAVAGAQEGDTVIVTGKGHEPTQEIAGVFHRYNDRDVFAAILAQHLAGHPTGRTA